MNDTRRMTNQLKQAFATVTPRSILVLLGALALGLCCLPHVLFAAPSDNPTLNDVLFPVLINQDVSTDKMASLIFGLFIGALLTAALYLFFIWTVMRDRSQVFLMLLVLCLSVNMAAANDQVVGLIGLDSEAMRHLLQSYSMILAYIFSIFFTYYFLDIDFNTPLLKAPLLLLGSILMLLLAYSAVDQNFVHFVLPALGTIAITIILIVGITCLYNGVSGSLTHITAFLFFLFGGLAGSLYDLGFIVNAEQADQITNGAYSLAAIMFAIVIAGQFATLQDAKERALGKSNERFALAAKGSNEGLFDWNLLTSEAYFSDQFKKILSMNLDNRPESFKRWWRLIYAVDQNIVRDSLRRFRRNRNAGVINIEYRVIRNDGHKRWIHTKAVATREPRTGKILRFVGSIGDVTSRKESEAELRASEMRFRSITEAHPVPVMIISLETMQVRYASPGAEILLGLPSGTLTSHTMDRFLTHVDERNEILEAMQASKEINLKEVTVTRGDGNPLIAALSARRIKYQSETSMVIGLYDLTESKESASKIAKQQEALQQSEKMAALGGLLAGVAHELNNPLSVIVGQSTLLIEGAKDPKIAGRGEKIFKAADRCSRIVKSFLALARRKPPERKPVNINNIINASMELLSYQFRNENIALQMELDADLPEINGDGDQLTQVFTNLELNAVQAMLNWKGTRHVTIKTQTHGIGEILITVSDTGPGIPPEIRTRVFEPFFTTKTGTGGTGVGLSLCLNIIETHGGHLELDETPGGGATFIITLPSTVKTTETKEEQVEAASHALPKLKILLVDDELELAQTLADLLEPEGHEIALAANGAIALEKLKKTVFDVVISDLRMPVMDGPTMYAEIAKTMPAYLRRVIFVTGDTLSSHIQSFLSQNPVFVIEKPYRLADVKQTIVKLLNGDAEQRNIGKTDSPPSAT